MKLITKNERGVVLLGPYETYLAEARSELAPLITGAELLTIDRFWLQGPQTFHDARLVSLQVSSTPSMEVRMSLKGPYFDRHFLLSYKHVTVFEASMPEPDADLLVHEVRAEGGMLLHEFHFDRGHTILIACERMTFEEVMDAG